MSRLTRYSVAACVITLNLILPLSVAQGDAGNCQSDSAASDPTEVVTLKAVGDIVLGNNWPSGGWPAGYEQNTTHQFKQVLGTAEVIFGNFEGALTTYNVSPKIPRMGAVFAFRMPPQFALVLKDAGFTAINLANNHTQDFGLQGLRDTKSNLTRADILVVGEPDHIALQKIGDVTLAWIGFSYLAAHNQLGDRVRLKALMLKARKKADLVIVSMQAGAEGSEALRVRDREEIFLGERRGNTFAFAREAVDLGADLVIGHGPHVLRGMECYRGKLIAYSLGNFAGYGSFSIQRAAAITAVLEVRLGKNRQTLGFNVIPLRFDDNRLPEIDEQNLAHYLINDLSHRPPLNGSIRLPVTEEGEANYRRWLAAAGLNKIINE